MKITAYHIKTLVLSLLLFGETFILMNKILEYVALQDYFSFSLEFSIFVALIMFATLVTYSLTIGAWGKKIQYLIVPMPIALAIFFSAATYNLMYAFITFLGVNLLLIYDVYKATELRGLLVKFDPRYILRISSKGILFVFSLASAVLLILHSNYKPINMNMGQMIYKASEQVIGQMMVLPQSDINIKNLVETQINNLIKPYQEFIPSIMAALTFAYFSFIGGVAHVLFTALIGHIFWLAKKTGFLKTEMVMVEQEKILF